MNPGMKLAKEKLESTLKAEQEAIRLVERALHVRDYLEASRALALAAQFRGAIRIYQGILDSEAESVPEPAFN
jgi:uncharacterized protein (DUF2267 family)